VTSLQWNVSSNEGRDGKAKGHTVFGTFAITSFRNRSNPAA
jgi:hypothetical protein